ncbi:cytosine/adenosine deaminase-related metal-dependent hydrolase [Arthrobacter sp. 1088]|uniref:amidohydrolase family protein n=1 Tax=Arthrobacter sp. 1088 TaxID=2817768 RepID=UPI002856C5F8|nr:amidohydrolase family protein [Arthrobacter sp. 1088]MDR6684673.1 cytosine/adenosine deaminase-related metal-dependent hydrolase [Arthrobacter sp. 1088]
MAEVEVVSNQAGAGCANCGSDAGLEGETRTVRNQLAQTGLLEDKVQRGSALAKMRGFGADGFRDQSRPLVLAPSWLLAHINDEMVLLADHEVVVKNGRIEAVRPRTGSTDERVDMPGQLLLPGLISMHSHVAGGAATRGYVEGNLTPMSKGAPLRQGRQFLKAMVLLEDLPDEDLDTMTALNLAEILRGGCTTQVEMSKGLRSMQSYVRVAREFGIRGYPSGAVPGMKRILPIWKRGTDDQALFDSVPETLAEIQENLDYARSINGVDDGRILPMMAPATNAVHTPETFAAMKSAAQELHGLHIHLQAGYGRAPQPDKVAMNRLWGQDEIPWLHSMGIFDGSVRVFGAHLLGIDFERDLPLLANSSFTFANCPSGTGAGVTPAQWPWPEVLGAGVNSGIGLDTHSNDYIENLKMAVIYGRIRADFLGDSTPVPMVRPSIWTAVEAATLGGARGLGREDLGRIAVGAKADLTSIDVSGMFVGVGTVPREPLNHLMYANGLSVRNVMTDGQWQVRDGALTIVDEAALVHKAGKVVQRIWDQMAADGVFVDEPRSDLIPAASLR